MTHLGQTRAVGIELRTPTADDVAAMVRCDERNFGKAWEPADLERELSRVELDRFRVAEDRGDIVGVAGSFGFDTTVHGGATLPTGGITWVSVAVTHRRQGLLRRLMEAVHADVDARGEPLAVLTASEGGIYERFGYGVTWHQRVVDIEARRAVFRPELRPSPGSVRLVDVREAPDELFEVLCKNWERYRFSQPGEVSRPDAWHRQRMRSYPSMAMYAVHADGHAIWSVGDAEWSGTQPQHSIRVFEIVACTSDAHAALWHTILSVDLVETVRCFRMPLDDPLPYLLTDPRQVRTAHLNDGGWANVRDVPAAFGARIYGSDDDVVVECEGTRWRIGASGCRRVRSRPDLVCGHSTLGTLLFGGIRPSELAAGRRLEARNDEALHRADQLFTLSPAPFCRTPY